MQDVFSLLCLEKLHKICEAYIYLANAEYDTEPYF